MATTVFMPEARVVGGRVVRGAEAELVVAEDGRVLPGDADVSTANLVRLPGKLLLPGFVNAHSHAFQRAIRGRTEFLATGHERDDFWSWREAMYATATALDPEGVYAVSRQAFLEMALAGVTTVGEFHYLHHQPDGTPYVDEQELALRVIAAARDVGLRLVLLRVGYARAGFNVAPNPRQRRFLDPDGDTFLRRAADLRARVSDPLVTVGVAPHSVRAVPRAWLEAVARGWREGPVHAHVAEQPAEVAACVAEHARRPVELLDEVGLLSERFTAVHAVHLEARETRALGAARATVCACPSTERNLGDGVVQADELAAAGVTLALGSDSQAQVDLLDEARQLEGHLRLLRLKRNVLDPGGGHPEGLAARLLDAMTRGGAKSLGLPGAGLDVGAPADFCTVDLAHPSLLGTGPGLLAAVVLGAPAAVLRDVAVAGRFIVRDGRHAQAEAIGREYLGAVRRLDQA